MSSTVQNVDVQRAPKLSPKNILTAAAWDVVLQSTCVEHPLAGEIIDPATITMTLANCLQELVETAKLSWSEDSIQQFYQWVEATYCALGNRYPSEEDENGGRWEENERAKNNTASVVIEAVRQFAPSLAQTRAAHAVLSKYEGGDVGALTDLFRALDGVMMSS